MAFTFAELLHSFRQRASIYQATLAAPLDVNRNTIELWECEEYLPHSRELVLRLTEKVTLTPSETDQLVRAAVFATA
jgi:DNA-binding XRE family transcriptional regulator